MRRISFAPYLCLGALALASCSDDGGSHFPPDSGIDQKGDVAGTLGFLERCVADGECASGRCLSLAGVMRCTATCSGDAECPDLHGWSCDGVCKCQPDGEAPTPCDADEDCDGEADAFPTWESCNEVDDDCNGAVDDVPAGTDGAELYYKDADEDGWGDIAWPRWFCSAPATGWTQKGGDCNDKAGTAYPGNVEICGDALDNDCDNKYEDSDICGLEPFPVDDVRVPGPSGTLKDCGENSGLDPQIDIWDVVAKQDNKPNVPEIKFTVRLLDAPSTDTCTTYKLAFGGPDKAYELVYLYRPAETACALAGVDPLEVFYQQQPLASAVDVGFSAAGHVSFIIPKDELFSHVPDPTYWLRACTNATADSVADITACTDDLCETPVHR